MAPVLFGVLVLLLAPALLDVVSWSAPVPDVELLEGGAVLLGILDCAALRVMGDSELGEVVELDVANASTSGGSVVKPL
jgi:hypothetical protein